MVKTLAKSILLILLAFQAGYAADNMKAFPTADEGMTRYVIELPEKDDESAFRVELIVGKEVRVDEQNRYHFSGRIEKETVEGWGFTLYKVNDLGQMTGTLMAVDPTSRKTTRFIRLAGEPYIVRYNSRLPIVVYVPEGVKVRYRVWTAGVMADAIEN